VIKKTLEFHNEPWIVWKGKRVKVNVKTHEGYMMYMEMLEDLDMVARYKEYLKAKFEEMVVWFHKHFLKYGIDVKIPPEIDGIKVCLFDLYMVIRHLGGNVLVNKRNKWEDVAKWLGIEKERIHKLKGIVERFLMLPEMYYEAAKQERHDELFIIHGNAKGKGVKHEAYREVDQKQKDQGDVMKVESYLVCESDEDGMCTPYLDEDHGNYKRKRKFVNEAAGPSSPKDQEGSSSKIRQMDCDDYVIISKD
jgi:hypothetical protein